MVKEAAILSEITYYPNGRFILVDQPYYKLVRLQPYHSFSLNETGAKVFKLLGKGKTLTELAEVLNIQKESNIQELDAFLKKAVNQMILTHEKSTHAEIRLKSNTTKPYLERIFLEVTAKCNFYCKHCYMSADTNVDTKMELTLDEIKDIILQADQLGVFRLDFTGGEIFVRNDIKEILQFASDNFMITNIFTNGYALSDEMCKFLADLGNIKIVFISMDDHNADNHDKFRGMPGSFERIVKGVKHLKKLGIRPVMNITLNKFNSQHIKEVIDFCKTTLEVECRVAPIIYVGRGKCFEKDNINMDVIVDTMDYSIGDLLDVPYEENITDLSHNFNEPSCGVGHKMMYIRSNGEICLCPTLSSRESADFELGNIRLHAVDDVWENSKKLNRFRHSFCRNQDCVHLPKCKGGCRSRAYLQNEDFYDIDTIICNYFDNKVKKKTYCVNPKSEFAMKDRFPVAITKGHKVLPLSKDIIAFLMKIGDGVNLGQAIAIFKSINKDVDGLKIVNRLIEQALLIEKKKFNWQSNTFGASLIDEEEQMAVQKVLSSKKLCRNSNNMLEDLKNMIRSSCSYFEEQLSKLINTKYVIALNSGTSALECALKAIGVNTIDDEVIVPCYTYIGTVSTVLSVGGKPVLCDIDDNYSLSCDHVEKYITKKTKAIICVHLRGKAVDIEGICAIAKKHNIGLIEDCAQSIGSIYKGKPVGSFGDIGCFSFHEHKIVSTGEGGAIATNRKDLYDKIRLLCDASRVFAYPELLPGIPGHNHRMTELQAAVGLVQLERLDYIKNHLIHLSLIFEKELSNVKGIKVVPLKEGDIPQSVYLCCETVELTDKLNSYLEDLGVPASILYKEDEINHNVYMYWPYIMEMAGYIETWDPRDNRLLSLFEPSLKRLRKTINISMGLKVPYTMASDLCREIKGFTQMNF
jgi:radical SAM protein with 4Fe4S-binding SPASM domain